jgi:hypothetical protein
VGLSGGQRKVTGTPVFSLHKSTINNLQWLIAALIQLGHYRLMIVEG